MKNVDSRKTLRARQTQTKQQIHCYKPKKSSHVVPQKLLTEDSTVHLDFGQVIALRINSLVLVQTLSNEQVLLALPAYLLGVRDRPHLLNSHPQLFQV